MTVETILWLSLGLNVVPVVVLGVVLRMSSRITTMRDNELKHIHEAIKDLTKRFNTHIEQHPKP